VTGASATPRDDGKSGSARWLIRFGYDGRRFDGWARQPGRTTIEGEILAGLRRRAGRSVVPSVEVASRTDRGVSARANALAVRANVSAGPLLRILNSLRPDLYFTAAAPIPDDFRVRHARRRYYRYFEPGSTEAIAVWAEGARLFEGTVDVRSFGRAVPASRPSFRPVEGVTVAPCPGGLQIDVVAPSFAWGMVRKIVSALREHARGRLSTDRLAGAIAGRERLSLPLAEPDGLVLWEVDYPIHWTKEWDGPNRSQRAYLRRTEVERWLGERVATAWAPAA
jgi:tRNA pseudouridine38-40 synthase